MTDEERRDHCRRIASKGGRSTVERHGVDHMRQIGSKGFAVAMQTVGGARLYEILGETYRAKFGRDPVRTISKEEYAARQKVRAEARALYPEIACVECGEPGQRHHIHGLAEGNSPGNIEGRCVEHHVDEERRIRNARREEYHKAKTTSKKQEG